MNSLPGSAGYHSQAAPLLRGGTGPGAFVPAGRLWGWQRRQGHGHASHPGLGSAGPLDGQSRPRRPEVGAAGALPEEKPIPPCGEPRGGGPLAAGAGAAGGAADGPGGLAGRPRVSRVTMVSFVLRRNLWLSVTGPQCGSVAQCGSGR